MARSITIGDISVGADHPLVFILGPCVVESETTTLAVAEEIRRLADELKFPVILKASFRKANRTSSQSFSGLEFSEALRILRTAKERYQLPILTDLHEKDEIEPVGAVADCLQIPAFLCRQTALIVAAAQTNLPLNIKKGQFLTPDDMAHAAHKAASGGSGGVLFTERGTTFGYGDLVVDFRGLTVMRHLGYPVCYDASHSVQKPGAAGGRSGGAREFLLPLARAAAAVGIDALFCETHPNPEQALSDPQTQWPLERLGELIEQVREFHLRERNFRG